jgi:hypothetical protein
MSALGQKRTNITAEAMSALPSKADIDRPDWHVRFVPKADKCTAAKRGGAGLMAVIVGKDRALVDDAVYVRRAVAHLSAVTGEPMSSPMMTRMFGFGCCAQAGAAAIIRMGHVART